MSSLLIALCAGLIVVGIMLSLAVLVIIRRIARIESKAVDESFVSEMFATFQSAMQDVLRGVDNRFTLLEARLDGFGRRIESIEMMMTKKAEE